MLNACKSEGKSLFLNKYQLIVSDFHYFFLDFTNLIHDLLAVKHLQAISS